MATRPRIFQVNIFYLDRSPIQCAQWHGDKHCVKQILECAQMLSTAWHLLSPEADHSELYKPTHINHPCSVWVRENTANYQWAYELLDALCLEFRIRRGKVHATERLLPLLRVKPDMPDAAENTLPALAMPDAFKCADPVAAYRRYYRQKYADGIARYRWLPEREPDWLKT